MRNPITSLPAPDPMKPFPDVDHSNLCPDFGQGYDPRDRDCVRCHMQLLCLHTYKVKFHPAKVQAIKETLGVRYFLDEARTEEFEDFYAAIVESFIGNPFDGDMCRERVTKNQSEWLQLEDPEFPEIVYQRIMRDPSLETKEGRLLWR